MKKARFLRCVALAGCVFSAASALFAQNSIQLFGPVNVRLSANGTSNANPNIFSSTTLQLSCPAGAPITAVLSGPITSSGPENLLVDNYVNLTVTTSGAEEDPTVGPTNVCRGGVSEGGYNDCFTTGYQGPASHGELTGQDPDNFTTPGVTLATGGVAPIDISSFLQPGTQQVTFDLVDTGGYLASSSLYLSTSCSQQGVKGPAQITGNPISSTKPTLQQLTQTFPFDSTTGQLLKFTYDLSAAESAETLTITDGSTPNLADMPIEPTAWAAYVTQTSFATSNCLTHTGELSPTTGNPVCKLYTLQCLIGQGTSQSGAQCPVSTSPNEVFMEDFDGPAFTLPDIVVTGGPTFHQGVGFLMGSEGWAPPGPCQFDPSTDFATLLCPQNLLVQFSGPGDYTSTIHGTHPNSSFITIAPVPEDLTTVTVAGQTPYGWINSSTANVTFSSQPPTFTGVANPPPAAANFLAAPIASITYGVSPASNVPLPPAPIPGDTTLTNSIACPTAGTKNYTATPFTPPQQQITFPGDGMYALHYFARDCASTEELKFTQDSMGSWSTLFYTVPVNVDTTAPAVASGPTLNPPPSTNFGVANSYAVGQSATAGYSCTDALSGVVTCGKSSFATPTQNTGPITSPIDTSKAGTYTFTVNVTDAAGNSGTPQSVSYTVVAPPPVNLAMIKLAPPVVKQNSVFEYDISAANFGKNPASGVVVTDALPAGVAFISADAQLFTCGAKGCSYTPEGSQCSYSGGTLTCTLNSLGVTNWSGLAVYNIEIKVRATGPTGSKIANTATITSENPNSNPNNQSTAFTKITK